jgi:pimeloyl-ACP methyl ester carboxylesterase
MKATRRQTFRKLAGLAAGGVLAGCGALALAPRERLNFVLVHGSWHGPWCWEKLAPLLRAEGHEVTAVDLQGGVPPAQLDLAAYVRRIIDALDAQNAPAVLVGHSSGALSASQAAEDRPDKVRSLVLLSAFVAANGEAHRNLVGADPEQKLSPVLRVDFRPGTKLPLQTRLDVANPEAVKLALYNDCSDADARAAIARLVAEPAAPSAQPLRLTPERFGRVDKVYIHCSLDNAISLGRQRQFAAKWPLRRSLMLESGHSPFLSMPARLAQMLSTELRA